jgi:UDP-glucose 4-epimerase
MIGKISEAKIFGNKYPTKDGSCIRDYVHVMDLAAAHVLAMEYLIKNPTLDFFNLGTENGTSVFQILKAAEDVIGKKINYSILENRPGDPPILIADASKAKSVLRWKPQYSSITILEHAWQWQNGLS